MNLTFDDWIMGITMAVGNDSQQRPAHQHTVNVSYDDWIMGITMAVETIHNSDQLANK